MLRANGYRHKARRILPINSPPVRVRAAMTSRYVVCRADELVKDDLMLEPWSGVLARVQGVEQLKTGLRQLRILLLVALSPVSLELPPKRLLRRQLRKGELAPPEPT